MPAESRNQAAPETPNLHNLRLPWQSQRTPQTEPRHPFPSLPPVARASNTPSYPRFRATPRFQAQPSIRASRVGFPDEPVAFQGLSTLEPPRTQIEKTEWESHSRRGQNGPDPTNNPLDGGDGRNPDVWACGEQHGQTTKLARSGFSVRKHEFAIATKSRYTTVTSDSEDEGNEEHDEHDVDGVDKIHGDKGAEENELSGSPEGSLDEVDLRADFGAHKTWAASGFGTRKRRRISISSSPPSLHTIQMQTCSQDENREAGNTLRPPLEDDEVMTDEPALLKHHGRHAKLFTFTRTAAFQEPTFSLRPAFKPDTNRPEVPDNLPPPAAIFSPHRRGAARYVSGGLAAGLQGWLGEVNTEWETGQVQGDPPKKRLTVDGLRKDERIIMVHSETGIRNALDGEEGDTMKVMLISGHRGRKLDEREPDYNPDAKICGGCVIGIKRPIWDVELTRYGNDKVKWTVCCDWSLSSEAQ